MNAERKNKRVVFSMGGKGGVGKTGLMVAMGEWFEANEIPFTLLDLDTENKARGSLKHFFNGSVAKVNIHTPAGLDTFVDHLESGAAIILADMGAGSGQVASEWFDTMYEDVSATGARFTAVGVVTPDPASVESVLAWAPRRDAKGSPWSPPVPIKARRSVAVMGFKNLSGKSDKDWLSTALSEMLTTELAAGEHLRTVPGENVAQMKSNLSLPDADSYGKDTLSKIRKNLSADDVVLSSYVPLAKGEIWLDLRLQDTAEGETLVAVSEKGRETQIDDLVSRAGAALREKMGEGEVSISEAAVVKASLPSNPAAAMLYSEGLAKLRVFDALQARDLLQKAIANEPTFALAHSALAAAWSNLGYDQKAKEEAKKAYDLSTNLSREERLWVEGQYRETIRDWDKGIEIYRTLSNFFPDNVDYGLRFASAQVSAGKGQDALSTLSALRKLQPSASDDPGGIDFLEARAAGSLGDHRREQAMAAKAADEVEARGAKLLAARALNWECWSFQKLGQPNLARPACERAITLYSSTGDRHALATATGNPAEVLYRQGDITQAKTKAGRGGRGILSNWRYVQNSLQCSTI